MNKPTNIDAYIASFPKDIQEILEQLRITIQKAAPKATATIKYAMPCFMLNGNLVYFAAYKNHIGFYPMPSAIKTFKKELVDFKTSKGAIQFPLDKPLPLKLITGMVKFRVKENLAKTVAKSTIKQKKK